MKANEINSEKVSKYQYLSYYLSSRKYKFMMSIGRCFPTDKNQAKHFINETNMMLDVLGAGDVKYIEELCAKHGLNGQIDYRYSKSKTWVRIELSSYPILEKVLRLEYGLPHPDQCGGKGTWIL